MDVARDEAFFSEDTAYRRIEALVWPQGPVCPHCGGSGVWAGACRGRAR